jgi:ferrous iron transport protein B
MKKLPLIALVGCPNAGKTSLFNRLTGGTQKVGNYAGVTVERKEGITHLADGTSVRLLDLPGVYSLRAHSPDEIITRDAVLGRLREIGTPDIIVCVADATNLKLHLRLVLELKQLGIPLILSLNMMDIAKRRGFHIDTDALSHLLGIPVVATVAVRRGSVEPLLHMIQNSFAEANVPVAAQEKSWHEPTSSELRALNRTVLHLLDRAQVAYGTPPVTTYRIDQVLLHPVFGILFLLLLMFLMFQAVFSWSSMPMDAIDTGMGHLSAWAKIIFPEGLLQSFITDGIISGVGSVIIFLPQILILYGFILVLEDSGYMARAAFLLDKIMGGVGLHGKAFIPLLSSFACAIPGIMATRTIASRHDRLTTILIAPLMTCSARLPVYVLIIAAFIPNTKIYGMGLQGLVMFGLYLVGLVSGLIVAFILKRLVFQQPQDHFTLELPSYKLPSLRSFSLGLLERARIFLRRAGTTIFVVMIVLWVCSSFPKAPIGEEANAIAYSITGIVGKTLAPLFAPIGFTWEMVVALIPAMAAREVAVSALGTVYAISDTEGSTLGTALAGAWPLASALAFLVWFIFAPQCISTLAVIRRETGSARWMWFTLAYLFILAYVASGITYHAALYFLS